VGKRAIQTSKGSPSRTGRAGKVFGPGWVTRTAASDPPAAVTTGRTSRSTASSSAAPAGPGSAHVPASTTPGPPRGACGPRPAGPPSTGGVPGVAGRRSSTSSESIMVALAASRWRAQTGPP
jgi:hypothetical protein